ncbi:10833_t:CDS:2 [Rhizophagus irregularis]|nr:10833_t:CDS:2 [Rhizophagus irregularis]
MSTTKEQTNDSEYVDWIKKEIENNNITYFNHNEFTNKQEFENSISSVGKIFKVNWSNNDNTRLIVKTPGLNVKKIINELKIRKEIDSHINILRIYGISKLDNKYSLVLEYADGDDFSNSLIDDDFDLNMNDIIQKNLLIDITDSDDVGKIIDKLIDHLIKLHDELGYEK